MEWLEPWWHVADAQPSFRDTFRDQLVKEVRRGHPMFGLPVELMARGNGDDCLFKILDGSNRVAMVHLVWQGRQTPPWPATAVYATLQDWCQQHMLPEHQEWANE